MESGNLRSGCGKGTLVERVVGNLLRLAGNFFEQILRRHAVVAQSVAHVPHRLVEHARNLVQTGQVVFVIFHVAERGIEGQRSVSQVNAAKLRRRHLPVFELCARRGASRKLRSISARLSFSCSGNPVTSMASKRASAWRACSMIVGNRLVGKIAQPVVVAVVSNLGGKLRLGAQRVLPLLGEQTIEFRPAWRLDGIVLVGSRVRVIQGVSNPGSKPRCSQDQSSMQKIQSV